MGANPGICRSLPYTQGMLTREQIDDYVAERGPYLYHRTRVENLPAMAREGIRPWSDGLSSVYQDSVLEPRRDHTYIGSSAYVCQAKLFGIMVRIDLRLLDPTAIDADEDQVAYGMRRDDEALYQFADSLDKFPDAGMQPPPFSEWRCQECRGAGCAKCNQMGLDYSRLPKFEESRGDWAERHKDVIDTPFATQYSLRHGSVAVRGGIPAAAISIDPRQAFPDHFSINVPARCLYGNDEARQPQVLTPSIGWPHKSKPLDFGLIRDDEVMMDAPSCSDLVEVIEVFKGSNVSVEPFAARWKDKEFLFELDDQGNIVSPPPDVVPQRDFLERWAIETRVEAILNQFPLGLGLPTPAPELESLEDALRPVSAASAAATELSL